MKFVIPIRYVLDINTMQIADIELWKAICRDMRCGSEGVTFGERNVITPENLLEFTEEEFPEGDCSLDDGLMEVYIYDYYDYDFHSIMTYCKENEIPIDTVVIPDSSECRYYEFFRPGFTSTSIIDANDYDEPVIPINRIMEIMNSAEESKTDTDIMLEISKKLDTLSPNSAINNIKNWA